LISIGSLTPGRQEKEEERKRDGCSPILLVKDDGLVVVEVEAFEKLAPDNGRFGGVFLYCTRSNGLHQRC
jgi:hypothetical protein